MPGLLINIDVSDLTAGEHFYTNALGLTAARRFDDDIVELTGCEVPIYLILKPAGSATGPGGGDFRHYNRHWTPVHPDFSVADLGDAIARARAAGAVQEGETLDLPYRSEEHTSELQSLMRISYAVFCLQQTNITNHH